MANFAELEKTAEKYVKYVKLKRTKRNGRRKNEIRSRAEQFINHIIGYFSSPKFAFPLER